MAMTPEGKVKKAVKDRLKKHGAYFFMPATGGYGKSGVADIVCCVNGFFLSIECKKDSHSKPTALQTANAYDVIRSGGITLLVHDKNLEIVDRVCGILQSAVDPLPQLSMWPVSENES